MKNPKIETINCLAHDIDDELFLLRHYWEDEQKAIQKSKETGKPYWQYMDWKGRKPNKTRVVDRCKIIRQILMEISKEAEQL
mgnify:CR=1 FL=1